MNGLAAAQRSYDRVLPMDCVAPEAPDASFWDAELRKLVMTEQTFPGLTEKAAEYVANDMPGWMTETQAVALLRAALTDDDAVILSIIKKLANEAIERSASSLADE